MLAHLGVMWAELTAHVGPSGGYVGQPRPKMRLLQTLRMGHKPPPPPQQQQQQTQTQTQTHTHTNTNTNTNTNKQTNKQASKQTNKQQTNKQTTTTDPTNTPQFTVFLWLSHATLQYFKSARTEGAGA